MEAPVAVSLFLSTMAQVKRSAAAPAAKAEAADVPVRRVNVGVMEPLEAGALPGIGAVREIPEADGTDGPWTSTPGAAISGLICPVLVKPRLLWM